jgi:uncharacterized protein
MLPSESMKEVALITGASSGIGKELAFIHAKKGGDLVLVARNKIALDVIAREIENSFQTKVLIIQADLSLVDSGLKLYNEVKNQGIQVDYLINNAGFGDFGMFHERDLKKFQEMIQLNITTLTDLTHLFLNEMVSRNSGRILNVASTAAFLPGPLMAVYFATKAYVLHFTEAVNNEVSHTNVRLTTLCPGATESGFIEAANLGESKLVKGRKLPSSKVVANYGYKAMLKGKSVAIHGLGNYLLANVIRLFPRNFVVKMTRIVQDKSV